jgi:hypothetical protein
MGGVGGAGGPAVTGIVRGSAGAGRASGGGGGMSDDGAAPGRRRRHT